MVEKVLITNDLTKPVFEEALNHKVNLILSYHPVIFEPLKRLTQSEWSQKSIVKCIENRIAVFSPHTTWVFNKYMIFIGNQLKKTLTK